MNPLLIPVDVWQTVILPCLPRQSLVEFFFSFFFCSFFLIRSKPQLVLCKVSSYWHNFFLSSPKLNTSLVSMSYNDYMQRNEYLGFLDSIGVGLSSLEIVSKHYMHRNDIYNRSDFRCLVPHNNSKCVLDGLKLVASHPSCKVECITLWTPFLLGIGMHGRKLVCSTRSIFNGKDESEVLDLAKWQEEMMVETPFTLVPKYSWSLILPKRLKTLKLVGSTGDTEPLFSETSIKDLASACPEMEELHLQSMPHSFDASWFPKLKKLVLKTGLVWKTLRWQNPSIALKKWHLNWRGSETLEVLIMNNVAEHVLMAILKDSPNVVELRFGFCFHRFLFAIVFSLLTHFCFSKNQVWENGDQRPGLWNARNQNRRW